MLCSVVIDMDALGVNLLRLDKAQVHADLYQTCSLAAIKGRQMLKR